MSASAIVLLGVVALASLAQAVFLVVLALQGRRIVRQVDEFQLRLGRELKPVVDDLTRATENLAEASEITALQMRRIDGLVGDAAARLSDTRGLIRDVILPSAARIMTVAAAARTIRKGIRLYRQLRG